ncbi:hypothetical protein [Falsirhodobacter sp. 1013]|uniref:hypothetical protein n=1 Tax=Falsirhodobacter sp. 1013 TaxID=3417566 RepID=UPI003EBC988F
MKEVDDLLADGQKRVSLRAERARAGQREVDKRSLSGSVVNAIRGVGALTFSVTPGEKVQGENTVTRGFSARLARPFLGRTTRMSLGFFQAGGENFFGIERQDRIFSLSVGREVGKRLWLGLGLGLRRLDSTADVYDENALTVDVFFTGRPF